MMGQLAQLFKATIEKKAIGTHAKDFHYDRPENFSTLWREAEDGSPCLEKAQPIVIAWDGEDESQSPDDETKKLRDLHLTPLDWALAVSNKVLEIKAQAVSNLRIHIVDLTVNFTALGLRLIRRY